MQDDQQAKKRKNGDDGEDKKDELDVHGSTVSRSDMDDILAEFKLDFSATITRQVESVFNSSVSTVLGKYDKRIQGELDDVRERVNTVERKTVKLEKDHEDMRGQLKDMAKALAISEKIQTVEDTKEFDWERKTNPTILKINTELAVHKIDVKNAITEWLASAAIEIDQWNILGSEVEANKYSLFNLQVQLGQLRGGQSKLTNPSEMTQENGKNCTQLHQEPQREAQEARGRRFQFMSPTIRTRNRSRLRRWRRNFSKRSTRSAPSSNANWSGGKGLSCTKAMTWPEWFPRPMVSVVLNGVSMPQRELTGKRSSAYFESSQRGRQQSGLPSNISLIDIAKGAGLRVSSWNARALLCQDVRKRTNKMVYLRTIIRKSDVILLQETHGYLELLDTLMSDL